MARLRKFKFKGYDSVTGKPKVRDDSNREVVEVPEGPPAHEQLDVEMVVFGQNPTWVFIRGRWYRIG